MLVEFIFKSVMMEIKREDDSDRVEELRRRLLKVKVDWFYSMSKFI